MSRKNRKSKSRTQTPTRSSKWTATWKIAMALLALAAVAFAASAFNNSRSATSSVEPPNLPSNSDKIDFAIVKTINEARATLLDNPPSGNNWSELGMRFMAHEFVDQAAICFEQATALDEKNPRWPYLHARCVDQIDPERAINLLRQAVDLCGNQPSGPRLFLVELLLQQQQLEGAKRELDSYLAYAPTEPRARHAKARLFALQNNFQACAEEIEAIQRRTKQQQSTLQSQINELLKSGRKKEAIAKRAAANRMLRPALAKQKSIGLLLANAYRNLGRIDEAERQRQLAETKDDNGWPDPFRAEVRTKQVGQKSLIVKADILFGQGRYEESDAILKQIVAEYPDTLFGRIYQARSCIRRGRISVDQKQDEETGRKLFREAQRILRETIKQTPDAPEALFRLGVATAYLADLNKDNALYDEAATIYRKAIAVKSDFTMAYFNLANCLDRSGDLQSSIEAMRGAVRCEPTHVEANAILGVLLSRGGDAEQAKKHLQLALQLDPNHALAKQTLRRLENR